MDGTGQGFSVQDTGVETTVDVSLSEPQRVLQMVGMLCGQIVVHVVKQHLLRDRGHLIASCEEMSVIEINGLCPNHVRRRDRCVSEDSTNADLSPFGFHNIKFVYCILEGCFGKHDIVVQDPHRFRG